MFQQIRNPVKQFHQHIGGLTSVLIPGPSDLMSKTNDQHPQRGVE
jgi:hypothetical protein